jgi:prepilin-type N-terminal cleavage/methylation domain-containing protein
MTRMRTTRAGRGGFTLLEILIVLLIIGILVTMLLTGVNKVLQRVDETTTHADISGLSSAHGSARTEFNLEYIPSFLVLREDNNYTAVSPYSAYYPRTLQILERMFGKRLQLPVYNAATNTGGTDWNNDGTITQGDIILEGHHCLVFFLGGIPAPPGGTNACLGFAADPQFPALASTPGKQRRGPFFEFKARRLIRDINPPVAGTGSGNGFYYYLDPYGKGPFAYFSSGRNGNDYCDAGNTLLTRLTDCPSLNNGISSQFLYPYCSSISATASPPVQFVNPNGFQIISAGKDGLFGNMGLGTPALNVGPLPATAPVWIPAIGWGLWTPLNPGGDDISNFSTNLLGKPVG